MYEEIFRAQGLFDTLAKPLSPTLNLADLRNEPSSHVRHPAIFYTRGFICHEQRQLDGFSYCASRLRLCDAVASGRLEMLEFEDLAILLQRASNAAK